jgi:hypothetical protein
MKQVVYIGENLLSDQLTHDINESLERYFSRADGKPYSSLKIKVIPNGDGTYDCIAQQVQQTKQ